MSVISQVRERHVINPAGDMICRESDAMKAVVVMSYSGCHVIYTAYNSINIVGPMS